MIKCDNKFRPILCLLLCLITIFTCLSSATITSKAANNPVTIKLYALGVTRGDNGQHNSTVFNDYAGALYTGSIPSSGFVNAYYIIDGLPYGSFDVTIEYSFYSNTIKSYGLQNDNTWSAGTQYDGQALNHGTRFYYDIGDNGKEILRSSTEKLSVLDEGYALIPLERRKMTFHVNDYTQGTACIALCYYVNKADSSGDGFGFKVHSLSYTTTEEHVQESLDNITNSDSADKEFTDSFQNSMGNQSGQVDNLVSDMNTMDKVDINNAGNITNDSVDFEAIGQYGNVLSTFTSNPIIVKYMVTLFGVGLCAYVLFGKRR